MKVKRPLNSNPFKIQKKKSLQLHSNIARKNNKFEQQKKDLILYQIIIVKNYSFTNK